VTRCDVNRTTFGVTDDQLDWIDDEAERLDQSRAWVVRECIDSVRSGADRLGADRNESDRVASDRLESVIDRLDDLEARVSALEPVSDAEIRDAADGIEWQLGWGGGEKHREAVAQAGQLLRDRGEAEMGRLDDESELEIESSQKILRHVRHLPWVEHGGGRKYYWIG
jgi:hypothetical protein